MGRGMCAARHALRLLLAVAALACLETTAAQPALTIEQEPAGDLVAVEVRTPPAEPGGAWRGSFHLNATEDVQLLFVPYRLRSPDGNDIGPENVGVPTEHSLRPGAPALFVVEVSGVRIGGNYTGVLQIFGATPNGTFPLGAVRLYLNATVDPALQLGHESRLQLSRCSWSFFCGVSEWLLPGSAGRSHTVLVNNAGAGRANVTQATLLLVRDTGQAKGPYDAVPDARAFPLDVGADGSITFDLRGHDLQAGHYNATLVASVPGASRPATFPLSVDVRSSPFWALAAILAGFALAVLFGAARRHLNPAHLAQKRLATLQRHATRVDLAGYPKIKKDLDGLVDAVGRGDRVGFHAVADRLRGQMRLAQHIEATRLKGVRKADSEMVSRAEAAKIALAEGREGPATGQLHRKTGQWKVRWRWAYPRVLAGLLGTLSAVLLSFVGMQELYLEDATFGAGGVLDYLPLVLWGFTGKVTTESLREFFAPDLPTLTSS